jgi:hypothetical protein
MALVDDIFGSIPAPLINQFGINATYIKLSQNQTYNPETGVVSGYSQEISVKAFIYTPSGNDLAGVKFEQIGVKFLLSTKELGGYYPQKGDSIRYSENGVQRTAIITGSDTSRGDNPIMHVVVARLS